MSAVRISKQALHEGRISPWLYGGFIELLDDLAPGMWAEMLSDRSFEGVLDATRWSYYNGAPNVCDREWDPSPTWSRDPSDPYNGSQSVRLCARERLNATLSQSGLAVRKGMMYRFSGWLRADAPGLLPRVTIRALNADGSWSALGVAELDAPGTAWTRQERAIICSGETERAVFEIRVRGTGSVWVDKLSLVPADNLQGWRADVVRAVKDACPALLRWGGSVVDPGGYQWKNGIGDRDDRTPFLNKPWGRMDSNDVGIDEFLRLCELVDAEPLICVSFADGPDNARDLVLYCNAGSDTVWGSKRAALGHHEPWGVRLWQIGNELGDESYRDGCAAFSRAIREADPAAVILSSYPSVDLLERAGAYLDFVCPHHYDPDLGVNETSIDNALEAIRSAALHRDVKLGITEWNITGGWWGNGRGRLLTLEAGLYAARYLNLLQRRSNVVRLACRSNMTNSFGAGMIQTNPAGLYLTPSYHVMRLYARHSKPVPLVTADVPHGLDLSACASEDRDRLCVFAVNATEEQCVLTLDLSDLGGGVRAVAAEVVCDTRRMRQPDLMNHFAAPDRVRTENLSVEGTEVRLPSLSVAAMEFMIDRS